MNNSRVTLKRVRFSYPHLFTPDEMTKTYSCQLLIDKNDPQVTEIKEAIAAAVENGAGILGKDYRVDLSAILHDGDSRVKPGENGETLNKEYAGHYYLNAKANLDHKPVVLKKTGLAGTAVAAEQADIYGGCRGGAEVFFCAFNQGANKGISCRLNGVIKLADDEAFGGGTNTTASLSSLTEDDDDIR